MYNLKSFSLKYIGREVAQLASALEWGSRGRGFKSHLPDFYISKGFEADRERHWYERAAAGFGGVPTNVRTGEKKSRLPRQRRWPSRPFFNADVKG